MLDARGQVMLHAFRSGKTLSEVGQEHGVSRERVRQILLQAGVTGRDPSGGVALRSEKRRAEKARREEKCRKEWLAYRTACAATYGLTLAQLATEDGQAFRRLCMNCKKRGIVCEISFEQFVRAWDDSGVRNQRGLGGSKFGISRIDFSRGYVAGNIVIRKNRESASEIRLQEETIMEWTF